MGKEAAPRRDQLADDFPSSPSLLHPSLLPCFVPYVDRVGAESTRAGMDSKVMICSTTIVHIRVDI